MHVRVVAVTAPLIEECSTAEEFLVYCARVSNPQNQANVQTAPRLIRYLIDNKHWSPFEMVSATVEIETSRAISAQILRHRSFSFQEHSQRYQDIGSLGCEVVLPRRQDIKNRQASHDDLPEGIKSGFEQSMRKVWDVAKTAYDEALGMGVAKESARFLLPLATSTRLYMSGSLRSWIHYLQVRDEDGVQLEHREIAQWVKLDLGPRFPETWKALGWYDEA